MALDANVFKSDFTEVAGKSNEEFLQHFVAVFRRKRGPSISRCIRDFGEVKKWDLANGIWCNPHDNRFNAVILLGDRANKELVHGATFSGMVVSLAQITEILGDYVVGTRQEDKSAAFIFTMNDSNAWIGAFEFNVRKRNFEKSDDGKLFELVEGGGKEEVNPADISFNVFTVHFVDPPGRTELFEEEENVKSERKKYDGMTSEEIAEAKRQEKLDRVKRLTKLGTD